MRCILHIGPPKTGSSSIQFFLRDHRDALDKAGFFIPRTQRMNMAEFQIATKADITASRVTRRLGVDADYLEDHQTRLHAKLEAQFQIAAKAGYHTAIVSNEGMSTPETVEPLIQTRDLLASSCAQITIVPILRRQERIAVSLYKNLVKNKGKTTRECLTQKQNFHLDWYLALWGEVFGHDHIHPILFPDSVPEHRDLIADFCAIAGIEGNL